MKAEEVLKAYEAAYETAPEFDPKHPQDPTVSRKDDGLPPLPMNAAQTAAVVELIGEGRADLIPLLLTQVAVGTGEAAFVKANFLESVASGKRIVKGLTPEEAVSHLGYMKGGEAVGALISLLDNPAVAQAACRELSMMVLIHKYFDDAVQKCESGNEYARKLMRSWANADWYAKRAPLPEAISAVVFKIPDDIEASTDFLSHSKGGHTRTDVPVHSKHYCMTPEMLAQIDDLKRDNPYTRVVLAADKIGTSSSRKSGMNNMEYIFGVENDDTRFMPAKKTQAIIFAGSVLGPIFEKTAFDMGSVIARVDTSLFNTGDKIVVRLNDGVVENENGEKICSFALTRAQKEEIRAGGGTRLRMGRILTAKARAYLGVSGDLPYETAQTDAVAKPMTRAQKIIAKAAKIAYAGAGMTVCPAVDTVASQDTTGPMTVQELQETLCVSKVSAPLFLQSQCHNAAMRFRTPAVVEANERLVGFVKEAGGVALNMGDGIIHSWLNELVMPDTLVVGGDSHTRVPTALSFAQGSGGVAEAAATGVTEFVVPPSVLVEISGDFNDGVTVRDLVNYIPYKALRAFGKNVFEGAMIEYRRAGAPFDMIDVFKLTNSSAERSAAAACFELDAQTVAEHLKKVSIPLIEDMIARGYDVQESLLKRLEKMRAFVENPVLLQADPQAQYAYVLKVDLAEIKEPYVACPHTPDNVKPLSELTGAPVDFTFIGSCMSGYKDFEAFERILRQTGKVAVEAWGAPPTHIIEKRLNAQGISASLKEKGVRLEVSGCSLCMGNQERVQGKKNVVTTSTRNFKGRMGDEANVYLASAELEAVCALAGRFPSVEEYMKAQKNG